jgi:site-specific DNA recombinase
VGKLFDDRGNRMSPSWSRRGSKRWRYYISQALLQGDRTKAGSVARVSAPEIENRIIEAVSKLGSVSSLGSPAGRSTRDRDGLADGDGTAVDDGDGRGKPAPSEGAEEQGSDRWIAIREFIDRVTLERTTIRIALSQNIDDDGEAQTLALPWTPPSPYRRREIIQGSSGESAHVRPMRQSARRVLVDALRKAHRWLDELLADPRLTVAAIGSCEGKSERSIEMILSLAVLAPDLVKAAVEGRLPRGFGLTCLTGLPIAWPDQWQSLGLISPARG